MSTSTLDIKVLGQLLLLQSSLQVSPDKKRLGELVCHIMNEIPGVDSVAIYIDNGIVAQTYNSIKNLDEWPVSWEEAEAFVAGFSPDETTHFHTLSIQTNKSTYGFLAFSLFCQESFFAYIAFIENTVNLIALMLENWKQEGELQQEKEFLNAVLDNISDGIVACNHNGILTLFNKATRRMHNLPAKLLPADQWAEQYDLYLAGGQTLMTKEEIPLYRAFQGEHVNNLEMVIAPKDGSHRSVVAAGQPLLNKENSIIGAVVSMHDITERKKAEEALQKAHDELEAKVKTRTLELQLSNNKLAKEIVERKKVEEELRQVYKMEAIGTLAGGIAHDFNNILAAILGYAEMASDDLPIYSPVKYQLEQIINAGNRARDLVKQILLFCRKESQEKEPIQLDELVEEALKLLRAVIPTTINIKKNIDVHGAVIFGEPTQIHQVVMNICTNAAQAMEEDGGILEISLACCSMRDTDLAHQLAPGDYVKLTIKDNGPGIPEEIRERICDPYFTTKEFGKGSGMGLAVASGIVRNHDGVIEVGKNQSEGASFIIFFPRYTYREKPIVVESNSVPFGNKEHVLLVDDDEIMVNLTTLSVERLGYQVTSLTDSRKALQLFHSKPNSFDLVITDQTMPDLTGDKLAKEVKRVRKNIPVILCTGYSSTIDAEKATSQGIDAFLMKPFNKMELAKTIRRLLDGNKSE